MGRRSALINAQAAAFRRGRAGESASGRLRATHWAQFASHLPAYGRYPLVRTICSVGSMLSWRTRKTFTPRRPSGRIASS